MATSLKGSIVAVVSTNPYDLWTEKR